MPRLTAKDFPQELLDYYDYYAHGKRRGTGLSGETRKNERQNASRGSGA